MFVRTNITLVISGIEVLSYLVSHITQKICKHKHKCNMVTLIQPDPNQEVIQAPIAITIANRRPINQSHATSSLLAIPLTLTVISCQVFTWHKHKCSMMVLIDPSTNYTWSWTDAQLTKAMPPRHFFPLHSRSLVYHVRHSHDTNTSAAWRHSLTQAPITCDHEPTPS